MTVLEVFHFIHKFTPTRNFFHEWTIIHQTKKRWNVLLGEWEISFAVLCGDGFKNGDIDWLNVHFCLRFNYSMNLLTPNLKRHTTALQIWHLCINLRFMIRSDNFLFLRLLSNFLQRNNCVKKLVSSNKFQISFTTWIIFPPPHLIQQNSLID